MTWEPTKEQIEEFVGSTGLGSIYSKTLLGLAYRLIVNDDLSDGFHTFKELYRYRLLYNAALFNAWADMALAVGVGGFDVHKSPRHHDGEYPFGDPGWFIVVAQLPTGQISNHYRTDDWGLFKIPARVRAAEWDGHTPAMAAECLEEFLRRV